MSNQLQLPGDTGLVINQEVAIYSGASKLVITEKEQADLVAPFDEKMIEIRPDGMIYLPQVFWRQRLNQAFGIGQWVIIPKNTPIDQDRNKLYFEGVLMIRGCYVATSVGEAEYHKTNSNQSWASVFEAAKSDSITRCCKDLGVASQLWMPQFINRWIGENAIQVFVEKNGKKSTAWRKKEAKPFWNEKGIVGGQQSNNQQQFNQSNQSQPVAQQPAPAPASAPKPLPFITTPQLQKVLDRVNAGDIKAYESALKAFQFNDVQKLQLEEAHKKHTPPAQQKPTNKEIPAEHFKPEAAALYGLDQAQMNLWQEQVKKCKTVADLQTLYRSEEKIIGKYPPIIGIFSARQTQIQNNNQTNQPA